MEAKHTEKDGGAQFKYTLKASSGYEAEGHYENVTPNQYRQVVAALNGTLKEANAAHDDLVKALQRAKDWISGAMEDKGWSLEHINNPPIGSHLDAINAALKKAGAA